MPCGWRPPGPAISSIPGAARPGFLEDSPSLFDHLIRPLQERGRDRQVESLGGLEIDDQLELGGPLDGKVGGVCAPQDLVNLGSGAPEEIRKTRPITHEAARLRPFPEREY